jgi:hypothetical protein
MTNETTVKACVVCGRGTGVTPVLIHDPSQLVGRLAGAELLKPSDYHDSEAR